MRVETGGIVEESGETSHIRDFIFLGFDGGVTMGLHDIFLVGEERENEETACSSISTIKMN